MTRIIARPDAGVTRGQLPPDWRGVGERLHETQSAHMRAARVLLDARAQARTIMASAQATAREIAAAELEAARQRGYVEGFAQAQRDLAPVAARVARLAENAMVGHAGSVRNLDGVVLELTMAIARAVVRHELSLAPDALVSIVRAALDDLSAEGGVVLRVHPDDEAILQPHVGSLGLPPSVQVALVGDPAVERGGCIVESGAGRVDATIERTLTLMEGLLHDRLDAVEQ